MYILKFGSLLALLAIGFIESFSFVKPITCLLQGKVLVVGAELFPPPSCVDMPGGRIYRSQIMGFVLLIVALTALSVLLWPWLSKLLQKTPFRSSTKSSVTSN